VLTVTHWEKGLQKCEDANFSINYMHLCVCKTQITVTSITSVETCLVLAPYFPGEEKQDLLDKNEQIRQNSILTALFYF
jgi:hypothetical protein